MSNSFARADHSTKWIPVKDISVLWIQAQRAPNDREAKRIADEFDPDAFGVVTVTMPNGKGIYHCIDGQTRIAAVRLALGEDQSVPCNVIADADIQKAAAIFIKMNSSRTKPQALDRFKVAVTAGSEVEVAVHKLLTSLGYTVNTSGADGSFAAVTQAVSIYKQHGMIVLRDTLLLIRQTWGRSVESVNGHIIGGYASLLVEFEADVDGKRIVKKMQKAYTPAKLLGSARAGKEVLGGSLALCVKRILLKTYNAGLHSDRLVTEEA